MSEDGENGDVLLREAMNGEETMNGAENKSSINWVSLSVAGLFFGGLLTMSIASISKASDVEALSNQTCIEVQQLKRSDERQNEVDRLRDVQFAELTKDVKQVQVDINKMQFKQDEQASVLRAIELSQQQILYSIKSFRFDQSSHNKTFPGSSFAGPKAGEEP